jgi:predicted PolB exonuclease-like 3'-5' exonuclease
MKNLVQGKATYQLLHETGFSLEEFLTKFHQDNIIDMKLNVTLSDRSVHTFEVCELLEALVTSFEVDGEEMIVEDKTAEEKKKITKLNLVNSVIKLAI